MKKSKTGSVYLVGAGPGDPGLLTQKGARLLKEADVILYDRLSAPVLEGFEGKGKLIYVGKRGRAPTVSQEKIHELLIDQARKGLMVVRLKGGDPFIFGRGGEEALALREAGILFEIVPGVSSAIAAPAYAGIPLTHRDFTSEVVFLTGHISEPKTKRQAFGKGVNWEAVSKLGTIVILMGREGLASHVRALIYHGKNPDTPAALISWGTTPQQKSLVTTLKNLPELADNTNLPSPAIAVVGEVASLHEKLDWFDPNILFVKKILVTQATEKKGRLADLFRQKGAVVIEAPVVSISPPASFKTLDAALKNAARYQLAVFTSRTTIEKIWERLEKLKLDSRIFAGMKVIAIGPQTAQALKEKGVTPDLVPTQSHSEGLLAALQKSRIALKNSRVFLPRAREGREELVVGLKKLGAKVDEVEAYRVVGSSGAKAKLKSSLKDGLPDWMVFTSGEAVRQLVSALSSSYLSRLLNVPVACIGPITKEVAQKAGFKRVLTAKKATLEDLVAVVETSK